MRMSTCSGLALCALLLPAVINGQQRTRPLSPRLSTDDLRAAAASSGVGKEEISSDTDGRKGTPVRNPLAVLRGSLARMSTITSLQTHLQSSSENGTRDVIEEMIKPDRIRIVAPDAEIIVIGRAYYIKRPGEDWQVTKSIAALSVSTPILDYAQFVNKMLTTPGISISGRLLGDEVIDGYTTVAYEFTVTEGKEKGTIEACVGKDDGYLRRFFLFAPSLTLKAWFSGINERFTIERPQIQVDE